MNIPGYSPRLRGRGRSNRQPLPKPLLNETPLGSLVLKTPVGRLVIPPGAEIHPLKEGFDLIREALDSIENGVPFSKWTEKILVMLQCSQWTRTEDRHHMWYIREVHEEAVEVAKKWHHIVLGPEENYPETCESMYEDFKRVYPTIDPTLNNYAQEASVQIFRLLQWIDRGAE